MASTSIDEEESFDLKLDSTAPLANAVPKPKTFFQKLDDWFWMDCHK